MRKGFQQSKKDYRCPSCKKIKPLNDFYRHLSKNNSIHPYCKLCWCERIRQRRKNLVSQGRCIQCWKKNTTNKVSCMPCVLKQRRKRKALWKNKDFVKAHNEGRRRYAQQLKDEVFSAYGGYKCCCCGEDEKIFLALDHIHNDGSIERKAFADGCRGATFYLRVRKLGYPKRYQVLCFNCNWAKARGGCPHQKRGSSGCVSRPLATSLPRTRKKRRG